MTASRQQVFISYQRTDEAFARQVRERLVATGVRAWMDQYDIPVGAYWPDEIDEALTSSDILVGILSPDAVESRNVKNEWDWAIQNDKRLLLLQVEPCVIPHRYVSINYIDATGSDPSAAMAVLVEALGVSDVTEDEFEIPETRYARSGDVNIAYQVSGEGPIDLIWVPGFMSNVEVDWEWPGLANLFRTLASKSRLIRLDKRGTGLSDRVPESDLPTLETRMDDVRTVMDAVDSERAVIFGSSEGATMSILFAATYPERTLGLILYGASAKGSWAPDYPWGHVPEDADGFFNRVLENWGKDDLELFDAAPSLAEHEEFQRWMGRRMRLSASPSAAVALQRMNAQNDVRHILSAIHVPTLVLHRTGDRMVHVEQGRYIARQISGARYVELPGEDHQFVGKEDALLEEISTFLEQVKPAPQVNRILATILVAEIDGPGTSARQRSDQDRHIESTVRQVMGHFNGREITLSGRHVLATFDGPSRAIRCAAVMLNAANSNEVAVRAGLHTGEVEIAGDEVRGMAIDIARAIASTAGPGEIITSRTVKDLVAGSGIVFQNRGTHTFAGIPDEWQLFLVDPDSV